MEEIPPRHPTPDAGPDRDRGPASDGRARQAWLARSLDREVRAPLLRAVLWAEHLLAERAGSPSGSEGPETKDHSLERDLVSALSRIEDILPLIRPDESPRRDTSWARSIVPRDLIGAAIRDLDPEIRRKDLEVDLRITPPDLRLVADPESSLHAAEALLRAAVRSAVPGSTVSIHVSRHRRPNDRFDDDTDSVSVIVDVPATEIHSGVQGSGSGRGRPWHWNGSPTGPFALAIAAADRFASLLGGTLDLHHPQGAPEGLRLRLRIPADSEAEHRPGWIP